MVSRSARIPPQPAHILTCDLQNQPRVSTRSRIPQAGTLREMNSATTNSRSGILPPGSIANKTLSRMSAAQELPSTLSKSSADTNLRQASRPKTAGPYDQKKSASTSRPTTPGSKMHGRNNSYASSTMSRVGSTTTRPTPGSYTASVGSGTRPASGLSRPNSALGLRKPQASSIQRPATSLDTHVEDGGPSVLPQKRKGTQFLSLDRVPSCPVGLPDSDSGLLLKDSLGTRTVPSEDTCHGFFASPDPPSQKCPAKSNAVAAAISSQFPQFPSPSKSLCSLPTSPTRTPRKTPRRPPPPLFLTKHSSVPAFDRKFDNHTDTEWNHESRERNMDEMFMTFMTRMTQQGQEASGWKDSVEIYKSRSAFYH